MNELDILEKNVIQANPLIRARKEMNVTEMRLFILGLQDIEPHILDENFHDVDFHETVISYSQLQELFGGGWYGNITNLKKQVKNAYNNTIELSYKDGGFGYRHIYRKMDYKPNQGLVIQFDDEMKPYILEILNQPYTKYKVKAFFSLSSAYAWRILESLLEKQGYLRQGKKEVYLSLSIEEIRFRLNIPDGLYKGRIDNFKLRVLDEPIREINEKTDYKVWYDVQRTGRKVTGFTLWLKMKEKKKKEKALSAPSEQAPESKPEPIEKELEDLGQTKLFAEVPEEHKALYTKMSKYFIDDKTAELITKYGVERVEANLEYAMAAHKTKKKDNLPGFIISCIELDHAARAETVATVAKAEAEKQRAELMARLEPLSTPEIDPTDKRTVKERFADFKSRHKKGGAD